MTILEGFDKGLLLDGISAKTLDVASESREVPVGGVRREAEGMPRPEIPKVGVTKVSRLQQSGSINQARKQWQRMSKRDCVSSRELGGGKMRHTQRRRGNEVKVGSGVGYVRVKNHLSSAILVSTLLGNGSHR